MRKSIAVGLAVMAALVAFALPPVVRNRGSAMELVNGEQDRVKSAYANAEGAVKELCRQAGVSYPAKRIYVRAFKRERQLELWGAPSGPEPFRLIHTYDIAAMSGKLGPKRRQGDLQVPEGFYHIDRFNPKSRFHLSLGINYPNASDRKLSDKERPGGDIFIHGNAVSIGCMAMTDPKIEEIYILALGARDAGQSKIPVHIFPYRMKDKPTGELASFWSDLKPVYDHFEKHRMVPNVKVDAKGRYSIR
jgi:murein L,D-transpeptidase YafK